MSEWTENVSSVPENVREYVCRAMILAELRRVQDGVEALSRSATASGYDMHHAKTLMKSALNDVYDIIFEQKKARAA